MVNASCFRSGNKHTTQITQQTISTKLYDTLQLWNLSSSAVASITTDNASNNQKAFRRFTWLPYFGHNLDLAVSKGLEVEVHGALVTVRKLVSGFNRSTKRKRLLAEKQAAKGLPLHQPTHDEPTRWGSTYHMVDRF